MSLLVVWRAPPQCSYVVSSLEIGVGFYAFGYSAIAATPSLAHDPPKQPAQPPSKLGIVPAGVGVLEVFPVSADEGMAGGISYWSVLPIPPQVE